MGTDVPEISVSDVKLLLSTAAPPRLIDVREQEEWDHCRIDGAEFLPLSQWPQLATERLTAKSQPLLIHCHHGGRSAKAVAWLIGNGFTDVRNVAGGIDAWSAEVDPAVPRY